MIENWNNFRDTENELHGDLSPYYYYKEEIEKMRLEDSILEKRIDEYQKSINYNSDNDSDSDI